MLDLRCWLMICSFVQCIIAVGKFYRYSRLFVVALIGKEMIEFVYNIMYRGKGGYHFESSLHKNSCASTENI